VVVLRSPDADASAGAGAGAGVLLYSLGGRVLDANKQVMTYRVVVSNGFILLLL
jgi:hypothetical protein